MGLAEKRAAAEFETKLFPDLVKKIHDAAGFAVPIEVRWDTLAKQEKYVARWNEGWPKLYFLPIVEALQRICVDDLGKQALATALKKIVVQDTRDSYSSNWAAFASGVLTLDYMYTNVDDVGERARTLREALEKEL
ncbi:MAG: hypothetical protein ABI867_31680 [Kofleriaceae bacterium]